MNQQEMKIIPPEGYEVDKENSTFECIKFKPIKQLPKTWEEFCETHPLKEGEAYINNAGKVSRFSSGYRNFSTDKNVLPSEKYAEAMLALCQLIQLRDCYNGSWRPDWHLDKNKYCIYYNDGKIVYTTSISRQFVLAFETSNLREEFYKNFVGLINRAKLLL